MCSSGQHRQYRAGGQRRKATTPHGASQRLDELLSTSESEALELAAQWKAEGRLRHFGGLPSALHACLPPGPHEASELSMPRACTGIGTQAGVPKRQYTIQDMILNGIDATKLLSPKDQSLGVARRTLQAAAMAGLVALAVATDYDSSRVIGAAAGLTFGVILDQVRTSSTALQAARHAAHAPHPTHHVQVANGGGGQSLLVDTLGRVLNASYGVCTGQACRCMCTHVRHVGSITRAHTRACRGARGLP